CAAAGAAASRSSAPSWGSSPSASSSITCVWSPPARGPATKPSASGAWAAVPAAPCSVSPTCGRIPGRSPSSAKGSVSSSTAAAACVASAAAGSTPGWCAWRSSKATAAAAAWRSRGWRCRGGKGPVPLFLGLSGGGAPLPLLPLGAGGGGTRGRGDGGEGGPEAAAGCRSPLPGGRWSRVTKTEPSRPPPPRPSPARAPSPRPERERAPPPRGKRATEINQGDEDARGQRGFAPGGAGDAPGDDAGGTDPLEPLAQAFAGDQIPPSGTDWTVHRGFRLPEPSRGGGSRRAPSPRRRPGSG